MMSIADRLARASGLAPTCATPSPAHERKLAAYLLNLSRGAEAVRDILVADIRGYADLGQPNVAADLMVVLRLLLARWPEARRGTGPALAWDAGAMERAGEGREIPG